MGLDGEAEVDLLDSNGDVISFCNNSVLISVDVPKDEEIRRSSRCSFTSENCMFDKRTIDYVCGLLSPTEFKMPRKKHRKGARIKTRNKRMLKIIEEAWYKNDYSENRCKSLC